MGAYALGDSGDDGDDELELHQHARRGTGGDKKESATRSTIDSLKLGQTHSLSIRGC